MNHVPGPVLLRQPAASPHRVARRTRLVPVVLLTALAIAWPAEPGVPGGWPVAVLVVAIAAGGCSVLELTLRGVRPLPDPALEGPVDQVIRVSLATLRGIPWPEVLVMASAALEALHPARPWHTGVLGVALLGFLFAIHLTGRNGAVGSLRSQLPPIVAGLALAALAVGATALGGLPGGAGAVVIRIVAITGAIFAAALVIPVWMTRDS